MSLNAWGGALWSDLGPWLASCGADVVCLQEVSRTPGLGGWTTFEDRHRRLRQRANLFDDVRAVLPGHRADYVACDTGPIRDPEGCIHAQELGLGVFVHDALTTIGGRASFVHGDHVVHTDEWAIDDRPRAAQGVRVVETATGRRVTVVHLHGLRDSSGKADIPARRRQAEALARFVDELRGVGDLTVVAGDLNLLPDSETFAILAGIGLTDMVGTAPTRTSHYPKPVPHADYLLVSDPDAVHRFEIVTDPEVSDHRPLVLDL
ncbi:MAG: endonuclease/exonuclease/phosphatase family protein [Acidimicrobiales bacterium]